MRIYIYRFVSTQSSISLLVQRLGMKGIGFKYKTNGTRSVYGRTVRRRVATKTK